MIKLLQPLDIVIKRPFEVAFWLLYNQWMTTTKHELTPSSRTKYTSLPTVCEWILAPWHSVSPEIVEKSFKVTISSNEREDSEEFTIDDIDKGN